MSNVGVQIVRYVDDAQPGWVEAKLWDAFGREWVFIDKVPIFTKEPLEASSLYPRPGVIACEVIRSWRDERGQGMCTIDTARPYAVEAEGGESRFDVLAEQLIRDWLPEATSCPALHDSSPPSSAAPLAPVAPPAPSGVADFAP